MDDKVDYLDEYFDGSAWKYKSDNVSMPQIYFARKRNDFEVVKRSDRRLSLCEGSCKQDGEWFSYPLPSFEPDFVIHKNSLDLKIAKLKALFLILHSLNGQNVVNEMLIELEI